MIRKVKLWPPRGLTEKTSQNIKMVGNNILYTTRSKI